MRSAVVLVALVALSGCVGSDDGEAAPAIDPNRGYGTLAPPEPSVTLLGAADLVDGFRDLVFTGCGTDHRAQLLRQAADGTAVWGSDVPYLNVPPFVVGEVVVGAFIGLGDLFTYQGLFGVDLATGAPRWQRYLDDDAYVTALTASSSGVVVRVGTLGESSSILAIDAVTGEMAWSSDLDGGSGVVSVDDVIVAATGDGVAGWRDGSMIWEVAGLGPTSVSRLGDSVVVSSSPGAVRSIDATTGDVRWVWESGSGVEVFVVGVRDDLLVVDLTNDYRASSDPDPRHEGVALVDVRSGAEVWSAVEVDVTWTGASVQLLPATDGSPVPPIDESPLGASFQLDEFAFPYWDASGTWTMALAGGDALLATADERAACE